MNSIPFTTTFAGPLATFTVAALFAAIIAIVLRIAWNPPMRTYVDYVPIGAVFIVFVWDRLLPTWSGNTRVALCDALVVGLALLRVIVPPLPFVSGHTLLATYAALTAVHWPLRTIAFVVLAQVVYVKIFVSGGWRSMLGGLAVAAIVATLSSLTNYPTRQR